MQTDWRRLKDAVTAALLLVLVTLAVGGPLVRWWSHSQQVSAVVQSGFPAATYDLSLSTARAKQAMSAVSAARQLLRGHHDSQAEKYLAKADHLLSPIDRDHAASGVDDHITLYSEFTLPKDSDQRLAAQQQLQQLAAAIKQGEHGKVMAALRQSGLPMVYRYLDLPVARVSEQVRQALSALRLHDSSQAEQILNQLEGGIKETVLAINGAVAPNLGLHATSSVFSGPASRRARDLGAHT